MMKRLLYLLTVALLPTAATADDIQTLSGKTYSNVTISRAEPDGLVVITDIGIEKIPFSDLSKEVQEKYGYDAQKAAAYQAQVQKTLRARQARTQAEMREIAARKELEAQSQSLDKAAVLVKGSVLSVTRQGVLLTDVSIGTNQLVPIQVGRHSLSDEPIYENQWRMQMSSYSEPVFIYGSFNMVDGQSFQRAVYPAPPYSYTSAIGAGKRVRAYAADKETAMRLNR